jgi:pimeloyl-ACP methyl ester carboxylesterase
VVRRAIIVLAAAFAAVPVTDAAAQAQLGPCTDRALRGAECGTVPVPLDHSDRSAQARRITVGFARFRATGSRRGTIVFIAGGPGQAAVAGARSLVSERGPLGALRARYDIVFVDQRGSGVSTPLRCADAPRGVFRSSVATPAEAARVVARCAAEIGPARRFFSTYETVLDIEDVRAALGESKIIPLGVSYGGQVAGEYARRYPDRVAALVLDSTSPIEGDDALSKLPQLALPRVLREVCFPPGCGALLGDPNALLAGAVQRLSRGPLRGRAVLPSGRRRAASVTLSDLYGLLRSSDLDPLVRTAIPAALDAALRGDAAPLLRMLVGASGGGESSGVNEIRFLATSCMEGRLPWAPDSDPASRPALLEQALAANAGSYAPFPVSVVARHTNAAQCLGWPATQRPPFPPSAERGPDVPVLVLAGREDLRTPLEDQRRAAAQFPRARVVAIPEVGHSVLTSDATRCARQTLRRFLAGLSDLSCRPVERPVPLALPVFSTLNRLPGAAGQAPPVVERTIVAVDLTLRDMLRQLRGLAIGSGQSASATSRTIRIGGLRGGRLELRTRGLTLVNYEVVGGVRVSGTLTPDNVGRLVVTGRGATGRLALTEGGRLVGTLGGTAIRYRPRGT